MHGIVITMDGLKNNFMQHSDYMQIAIQEAELAVKQGEIPVGAVLVVNGKIIAKAHNQRETTCDATAHAEILAIREACAKLQNWRLTGADLYVTLEPCPMCAGAIVNARISRVIYGVADSKAGGVDSLFNIVNNKNLDHRVEILSGICENECKIILQKFLQKKRGENNA